MAEMKFNWVDNPTVSGIAECNTDVLNDCLMHLKYDKSGSGLDDKITNCLLEVPQRIKYTLENGTLTIKAGSVVIVPYGVEDLTAQYPVGSTFINDNFKVYDTQFANGKFFVWAELVNDISTYRETTSAGNTRIIYMALENEAPLQVGLNATSGTTINANTTNYNTTTNKVSYYNASSVLTLDNCALPLGLVKSNSTYVIAEVTQIFNGMGYIGSTVWVDKGVKGLIPNGRNEDGTLNNIEYTNPSLLTRTLTHTQANDELAINSGIYAGGHSIARHPHYELRDDNYLYYTSASNAGQKVEGLVVYGNCDVTSGVVSNFNPKQPFRAVDYNELQEVHCVVETYQNGTSWYRVWSDGWCEQGEHYSQAGATTYTRTFLKTFSSAPTIKISPLMNSTSNLGYRQMGYDVTGRGFTAYTGTATDYISWYACGYIV